MSLKLVFLFVVCYYVSVVTSNDSRGFYTIVAPGTIRSHSTYHVSISLSDFNQSCWFSVGIMVFNQGIQQIEDAVEVQPGTTELLKLQIPAVKSTDGMLTIIGFTGILSQDMGILVVEQRHYTAYIQTDKPKYRPGELMQFRVICIDRLTLPAEVTEDLTVQIFDAQRNVVKAISKIQLVKGVFKGSLAISEHPNLGNWEILVNADGDTLTRKTIPIRKYVLPLFSVTIITKPDIALEEDEMELSIQSSYTYGELVNGNMTLLIHTSYSSFETDRSVIRRELTTDGIVVVKLNFKTDLNIMGNSTDRRSIRLYTFNVEAIVEDQMNRQTSKTTVPVNIHNHPYRIKVDAPKLYNPLRLVTINIIITNLQGDRIHDPTNAVEIIIEGNRFADTSNLTIFKSVEKDKMSYLASPMIETRKVFLNENGVASATFNLTDERFTVFQARAVYLGWMSRTEKMQKKEDVNFELDVLSENPAVNTELVVRLTSIDPIHYFVCDVISRGNIIQTERVIVPNNATTHLIRVPIIYSMVPRIFLYVHRIKGTAFNSKLKEVLIRESLENSINITCEETVKPGTQVSLNVTTDEGSYVGLMGVDQKLLIDEPNNDNFTEEQIIADLRNFDSQVATIVDHPGVEAGLLTFSNAYDHKGSEIGTGFAFTGGIQPEKADRPEVSLPRIRELFAESWIFQDFEDTPKDGLRLRETIPDTITSWAITGFSLNPKSGFSLTKNTTNLRVFQEFFISMELPYSIKIGEKLEVRIFVFNYMEEDMPTNITIDYPDTDLMFESPDTLTGIRANESFGITIGAKDRAELKFYVTGAAAGKYNVTVTAISPSASDAIRKPLTVDYVGVPYAVSRTYLVHFPHNSTQEDEIEIDIPDSCLHGSEIIHLTVIGDVFGLLTRSLQKMVRVPYGNGWQNMDYFMSNLLVLKYLKALNHSNPSLESQTKIHLDLGFQNLLKFKQLDGSFSIFDRRKERTGDVWLTAYTFWGFLQAMPYFHIDDNLIKRITYYFTEKQNEQGGFSSSAKLEDDVMLASLVTLSFLSRDKHTLSEKEVLDKALDFIYTNLNELNGPESVAMPIYALTTAKHNHSHELIKKLKTQDLVTSKVIMWTKNETLQASLEATAASFMSLFESEDNPAQNWLPIVKALVSMKQTGKLPNQMLALEAMIRFAEDIKFGERDLRIKFRNDQGQSGDFQVDTGNSQVLQTVGLDKSSRKVKLNTEGLGFAVVSLMYQYNVLAENTSTSTYNTNLTVQMQTDTFIGFEVCVSGHLKNSASNVTAMEVYLPSGCSINEKSFGEIEENNEWVEGVQMYGNEGSVLMYFNGVPDNGTCVHLNAKKLFSVVNANGISVIVYNVENEAQRSISHYPVTDPTTHQNNKLIKPS